MLLTNCTIRITTTNQGGCNTNGKKRKAYTEFWLENLKIGDQFEALKHKYMGGIKTDNEESWFAIIN